MTLSLGAHLGRYTVVEPVGAGPNAEVYRGHDEVLGRVVALKLLAGASEQARREAMVVATLNHPTIVATFDVIEHEGRICLVQEWIDGGSLAAELDSVARLSVRETGRMGEAVASALSYAHRHGILHRDIKPSNVLRTAAGSYKLTDFGAVGRLRPGTSSTSAGEIAGTPLYMSVEQSTGAPQTPASDLFGFGLLLYRCLHGHLPDETADNYFQLLQSRTQQPISVPPSPLHGLLTRCLALDPAQRPQSADEVLTQLRQIRLSAPPAVLEPTCPPLAPSPAPTPPGKLGDRNYGGPQFRLEAQNNLSISRRRGSRLILVGLAVGVVLGVFAAVVWLAGVEKALSAGAGLAVVIGTLATAQRIRRRWASRAPEAEQRAATILFGAGRREELTQSLMIEVDQVVSNLKSFDAKFLGMTVVAMIHEYEAGKESAERQAALLNVVALMEKLQARCSPWHIRHKDAIATGIAVTGSLVGVAGVISAFLK